MLVPGHVAGLVTVEDQAALVGSAEVAGRVSGLGGKRFRLNRKTPAHLVGHYMHARPRVWRRLHCFGILVFRMLIVKGGVAINRMMMAVLFIPGLVWVDFGAAQAHVSSLHVGIGS